MGPLTVKAHCGITLFDMSTRGTVCYCVKKKKKGSDTSFPLKTLNLISRKLEALGIEIVFATISNANL